jgi:UrcA family protein
MVTATPKQNPVRSATARLAALAGIALTAVSAAGWSTAARADSSATEVPSIKVQYGDLNLPSESGSQVLYKRIVAAARQVCPIAHSADLYLVVTSEKCQASAIAKAVSEVNNPKLALVYASHTQHG